MAKKKLLDVYNLVDGRYVCKLCADYDTQLENKARAHAIVKHLVELEPVVVVVPKRGTLPETMDVVVVEEDFPPAIS